VNNAAGMTLGQRIRASRRAKGLSQREVGRRLGVTKNAVSLWEMDRAAPTSGHLRQLAVELEIDSEWLATGRGARDGSISQGLPIQGAVAAGVWREPPSDIVEGDYEIAPVAPDRRFPIDSQYILRVEGVSMDKVAPPGSLLHCVDIVKSGLEIQHGDIVVVERCRHGLYETTVKRVRKTGDRVQLWPESGDPAHQKPIDLGTKGDQVVVKALVIYVIRPVSRLR
jgi:SOS-response transcriptional repressor LexA